MASLTWYDLLGVDRDATPEQIREAWREATDRAEPGTSQFKKYNEAAEVLLDPQARAAYDAQLPPAPSPSWNRSPSPEPESEPSAPAAASGPTRPPPSSRTRDAPATAATRSAAASRLGRRAGLHGRHDRGHPGDRAGDRGRRLLLVPEPPARRAGRRRAGGLGRRRAGAAVRAVLRLPPAPGRQGPRGALPEPEVQEGVPRHLRQADRLRRTASPARPSRPRRWSRPRCAASAWSTPRPTWPR